MENQLETSGHWVPLAGDFNSPQCLVGEEPPCVVVVPEHGNSQQLLNNVYFKNPGKGHVSWNQLVGT